MSKFNRGGALRLAALASAVGMALAVAPTASAEKLKFTQLAQEETQWCWAASGLSIAQFLGTGKDVSQKQFCNLARERPQDDECANEPDLLETVQVGFKAIGMTPGDVLKNPAPQADVEKLIAAGKPLETGVYWTQGGGHAQVVFGLVGDTLSYGDPWASSPRYSEMPYSEYVENSKHRWAESLVNMGVQ